LNNRTDPLSDFDPLDVESDNIVGFGYVGMLKMNLSNEFQVEFDEDSVNGEINANFVTEADLIVNWPNWPWQQDAANSYKCRVIGDGKIKKESDKVCLSGNVSLYYQGEVVGSNDPKTFEKDATLNIDLNL